MNFGWPELLIILIIAVLVFGVGKFQDVGKLLGKNIRDFKSEVKKESSKDVSNDEIEDKKIQ